MNDATAVETKKIYDKGIEEGAAKLTPERIQKVYRQMMDAEAGARLKTYVESCVSCGLCSEACHFYLSNDKDPRFAPAGKVRQTMAELMKKKGKVSVAFMKKASEIASTECNLCKRCAQYCPFGLDVAFVMLFVRRLCHKLGISPQYIQDTAHSHSATCNQMWVKEDEWIDSLQWQEEEAQEEIENLRIPVEKEGADIFYSVIGPEPKFRAQ
ncbi:MAG: (Fe-S)-binding protein, partial [Desulfobacterales bacterium]